MKCSLGSAFSAPSQHTSDPFDIKLIDFGAIEKTSAAYISKLNVDFFEEDILPESEKNCIYET